MEDPPALVPVDDVKALLALPAPNTHYHALPLPVRETLTHAESGLRREVYKLLQDIHDQPPLSEAYASLSLRLSSTLKDYMNISGATEAQNDMATIKRARVAVETFIEKQLRQRQMNSEDGSALSPHAPSPHAAVYDEDTVSALETDDPPPPPPDDSELDEFEFTL